MNFWFADGRAKVRLQKVEIAPFVGLLDMLGEHPAITAFVMCLRLLPRRAPLFQLGLRDIVHLTTCHSIDLAALGCLLTEVNRLLLLRCGNACS